MKKQIILTGILSCCSIFSFAQNPIDNYLSGTNTFTIIGTSTNSLSAPHDLDFVPGRPNEWWVLNKETNGGSVVIFFDAGKPTQTSQFRRDSHNDHFMPRSVAIAMGDNGNFASAQEIKNTASPSSTFMGPALWSNDTSIFARMHQSNWDPNLPLGSHIDMLHQSPFGMGIAHDNANVYWYFDGHNSNICKYDFATPHAVGADDHADGKIHRYAEVSVARKPDVPSHLALDKQNSWLYIVDGGNNKIIRLKTNSGSITGNLSVPSTSNEPLAEYKSITGVTQEVVASSGFTSPCGIDYKSGRIIVSDNADGKIHIYDVTATPATLVGSINTGAAGVMGVRIDNDNKIWYVNKTTKQLIRIDNPNVLGISETIANTLQFAVYPNPSAGKFTIELDNTKEATINVTDMFGRFIGQYKKANGKKDFTLDLSNHASGTYLIKVIADNEIGYQKLTLTK